MLFFTIPTHRHFFDALLTHASPDSPPRCSRRGRVRHRQRVRGDGAQPRQGQELRPGHTEDIQRVGARIPGRRARGPRRYGPHRRGRGQVHARPVRRVRVLHAGGDERDGPPEPGVRGRRERRDAGRRRQARGPAAESLGAVAHRASHADRRALPHRVRPLR